jgi:hypothetical protein
MSEAGQAFAAAGGAAEAVPPRARSVASLTVRMGSGDEEAFREFFSRYCHRLLA